MGERRLCRLHQAEGREEECPENACVFWEPGGAVLEGRCGLEQVDLTANPELAGWLLDLRRRLDEVGEWPGRPPDEPRATQPDL